MAWSIHNQKQWCPVISPPKLDALTVGSRRFKYCMVVQFLWAMCNVHITPWVAHNWFLFKSDCKTDIHEKQQLRDLSHKWMVVSTQLATIYVICKKMSFIYPQIVTVEGWHSCLITHTSVPQWVLTYTLTGELIKPFQLGVEWLKMNGMRSWDGTVGRRSASGCQPWQVAKNRWSSVSHLGRLRGENEFEPHPQNKILVPFRHPLSFL